MAIIGSESSTQGIGNQWRLGPLNSIAINGSVDVNVQDQTTEIVDLHLTRYIQDVSVGTNASIDDTTISLLPDSGPMTVGHTICLKEGTAFYQGTILGITGTGPYDVELDTPLDYAYTTAAVAHEGDPDLAIDGSTTTRYYKVSPSGLDSTVEWDITRIAFMMVGSSAGDDGKFGSLSPLTKGIVLRYTDGITKNIFNAKSNGDLSLHTGGDVAYTTRTVPGTSYGTRARRTFSGQEKNGVTIRLSEATDDELVIIVQDDLSGLTSFEAVAQGHVVDP